MQLTRLGLRCICCLPAGLWSATKDSTADSQQLISPPPPRALLSLSFTGDLHSNCWIGMHFSVSINHCSKLVQADEIRLCLSHSRLGWNRPTWNVLVNLLRNVFQVDSNISVGFSEYKMYNKSFWIINDVEEKRFTRFYWNFKYAINWWTSIKT